MRRVTPFFMFFQFFVELSGCTQRALSSAIRGPQRSIRLHVKDCGYI
jgi:hypothetical protein